MSAKLEAIWLKRKRRGPMDPAATVRTLARSGLAGNVHQGGRRQVTLLSAEAWQEAEQELGRSLHPTLRRANLMVSGIDLEQSRGRMLAIGQVQILIRGETKPCNQMEEARTGLRRTLSVGWRGGVYGEVLTDGDLTVGDRVRWVDVSRS